MSAIRKQTRGISLAHAKDMVFGVQARFWRSNRQRIDIDNLLKTTLDSITQSGFWLDDSRVHEICGSVEKGADRPRVEFMVYRYRSHGRVRPGSKYDFPAKCAQCGGEMDKRKSHPSSIRRFCSHECYSLFKTVELECTYCHKVFRIPISLRRGNKRKDGTYSGRRFCSRECSIEFHRSLSRIKGKESDKWVCAKCGGRVSRKEYKVCRACSMTMRADPTSNYWKLRHGRTD